MTRLRSNKHGQTRTPTDRRGLYCPCKSVQVRVGPCLLLLALAGAVFGSIPSATVPPTSYQSGLVSTPNPIDQSANLPITGNVAGGKYFHGSIPYGSTTSFGAPLGSTRLDSFLRYSTVPETRSNYPQNYSPYYSPTGTVATTVPGYPGVFSPSSPRIADGMGQFRTDQPIDTTIGGEVLQAQVYVGQWSAAVGSDIGVSPRLRYQPMSPSAGEKNGLVSEELGYRLPERPLSPTGEPLMTPAEYQQRLEQLRRDVERIQNSASQIAQNPDVENATTNAQPPLQQPWRDTLAQAPPVVPPGPTATAGLLTNLPSSGRLELYDPATGREAALSMPPTEVGQADEPSAQTAAPESGRLPAWQRIEETSRAFDTASRFLNRAPDQSPGAARATLDRFQHPSEGDRTARHPAEPNPADAQANALQKPSADAQGAHGVSASMTQKQFDHYLSAAQLYIQQGRYSRAADSFTLASVYIPQDPRAHLGKSLALLAAGEYTSSAAALAKALELDARYALGKVDLVETIGGPDAFVTRITKLEEQAGDTPSLQFLLAYVYFQMNLPTEARTAIETARKGLPSSTAVNLLAAAIQGTAGK